jgi:hypothetical protein
MTDQPEETDDSDIPEGAAVFPLIPEEVGVNPLLLAVLHATVFLAGSDDEVVHSAAADEAVQHMATYLGRLDGEPLKRLREDLDTLAGYARDQKWPKGMIQAIKSFLSDYGIEEGVA